MSSIQNHCFLFFMTHSDQPNCSLYVLVAPLFQVFSSPSLTLGLVREPASGFREKLDYQFFLPRRISGCFLQIDSPAPESSASSGWGRDHLALPHQIIILLYLFSRADLIICITKRVDEVKDALTQAQMQLTFSKGSKYTNNNKKTIKFW